MALQIKKLKIVDNFENNSKMERYNEDFIKILDQLKNIMMQQGEPFRARAYQKAMESIILFKENITEPSKQLKGVAGIGTTILEKFNEFIKTGKLEALEKEKENPLNKLTEIFGIGPKKAKELIGMGITTLDQLRQNPNLLNDKQFIGLKYHGDIIQRIPRKEIEFFNNSLEEIFKKEGPSGSRFEIVGSFRRGTKTSGDIDIIITNSNNNNTFDIILDKLIKEKVIIEVLSRGKTKSLTIVRVFPDQPDSPVRRADFLYSSPDEYAFALLYFTGSKIFNTILRQRALDLGMTLNEHALTKVEQGTKTTKIEDKFEDEKSIFDFLGVEYKAPHERIDGRAIEIKIENPKKKKETLGNHNKTLKSMPSNNGNLIEKFKTQGISAIKLMTEKELVNIINEANQAYYCYDKPILTDNLYEILTSYGKEKYPHNETFKEGHTNCGMESKKNKIKLPYELWSMDKVKPDSMATTQWTEKYEGPYVVSAKLDGVSGLYTAVKGQVKLYTRGNGVIGQDISNHITGLKLPDIRSDKDTIAIRGEFIIGKEKFKEKYGKSFANPRNFVAGVMNQKVPDKEKCGDIDFVAYEVISPSLKPSDQIKFLESSNWKGKGGKVVKYECRGKGNITNENLSEILLLWREKYEYEIDGVIIVDDKIYPRPKKNPEYAIAFKMIIADQVAETIVVDVLWAPSKDGYLKPRVQIEPVILNGVKIEYATGFNAKFIVENKIGIGTMIRIIRSGDVIPHIQAVISEGDEPCLPNVPYKWTESGVDIIIDNKEENETVQLKNITGFFKHLEIEGLGVGNLKKIMATGNNTIPKIIAMSKKDFLKVEGFKEKMAEKVYSGIREKIKEANLPTLMAASNIFGRGFGEKRFEEILKQIPDVITNKNGISNKERISQIIKIDGFAQKTAEKFVEGIPKFMEFIQQANLLEKLDYKIQIKQTSHHPLNGKKIVMTGFRDKALIKEIEKVGGEMGATVSANTFTLLVLNKYEGTGKVDLAKKHSIPIMTPDEFINKWLTPASEVKKCSFCNQPMHLKADSIDWEEIGFHSQCDNCCCGACGSRKKEEGMECC